MNGLLTLILRRLARRVFYKLMPTGRITSAYRMGRGAARLAGRPFGFVARRRPSRGKSSGRPSLLAAKFGRG
ncbi:MAG: hypothetical protein ABW208_03285 [Pyrinomonadaceae bacterium]